MAVALDDDLNGVEEARLESHHAQTKTGDPHHGNTAPGIRNGWLYGDTYHAIFGGERPAIAKALEPGGRMEVAVETLWPTPWRAVHQLRHRARLFQTGNKQISKMLCISHRLGCRY